MKEFLLLSRLDLFAPKLDAAIPRSLGDMSVLCIPTAANVEKDPWWLEAEMAVLKEKVRLFKTFDLLNKTEAEVDAAMQDIDIIYVTGGNTYYLLEQMQRCGFGNSLARAFTRKALYIGVSAGAVVACADIRFIQDMDDASHANLTSFKGLNLTNLMVLPHLDMEAYQTQVKAIIEGWTGDKGHLLALRDDQGLYGRGKYLQVF